MMQEYNNYQILQILGERFKQCRLNARMTQGELARLSGVSDVTIRKFENGTLTNITMNNLLSMLRFTGLLENVNRLIPEQMPSPYARKQKMRVRHAKHYSTDD